MYQNMDRRTHHAQIPIIEVAVTFAIKEKTKLATWLTSSACSRNACCGDLLIGHTAMAVRNVMVVSTDTVDT